MDWPVSLPQTIDRDGYEETFVDTTIRTQMDAGEPKTRRRFTAGIQPISIRMIMTDSQVEILEDFYKIDTASGSLPFDWTHPRTGAPVQMKFQSPPTIRALEHEAEALFIVDVMPQVFGIVIAVKDYPTITEHLAVNGLAIVVYDMPTVIENVQAGSS